MNLRAKLSSGVNVDKSKRKKAESSGTENAQGNAHCCESPSDKDVAAAPGHTLQRTSIQDSLGASSEFPPEVLRLLDIICEIISSVASQEDSDSSSNL